jgi:general secretion pathway protein D
MDWLYQRGAISAGNRPGSFARGGDPIFINSATGNITTRLRTFLTDSGGKTVNAPLLRTLNNQFASVQQSIATTIFVPSTNNAAGGIVTTFNPQSITVSTGLAVRPRINGDGTVTMTLQPFIGDLGQTRRGPDGSEVPDQLTQSLNVVARVKSGDTIALGGLTRKQSNTTVSRFPILSDLPVIGQLFRTTSTQRNDSELIVFVTPIVIEDDSIGGFTP